MVSLPDYQEQKLEELRGEGEGQVLRVLVLAQSTWVCRVVIEVCEPRGWAAV